MNETRFCPEKKVHNGIELDINVVSDHCGTDIITFSFKTNI